MLPKAGKVLDSASGLRVPPSCKGDMDCEKRKEADACGNMRSEKKAGFFLGTRGIRCLLWFLQQPGCPEV
jgi:hypothetical protein